MTHSDQSDRGSDSRFDDVIVGGGCIGHRKGEINNRNGEKQQCHEYKPKTRRKIHFCEELEGKCDEVGWMRGNVFG
jgi:hypothetical protein